MPTGGFLTGPTHNVGPQPVRITNLGTSPQTFSLQPVATAMHSGACLPTTIPVPWAHVAERVTVPAGKTVSVPFTVSGAHQADVAVRVAPVPVAGHGVGVAYSAYAQEIIGGVTASGCSHIRGIAAPAAAVRPSGASSLDAALLGVLIVLVGVMVVVLRRVRQAHRRGAMGGLVKHMPADKVSHRKPSERPRHKVSR